MKLTINNVSKSYQKGKKKALNEFSVELTPGVYGFLGPNGAGKSTLMNIITDNIKADSGEVLFNDKNVLAMGKEFRDILGYMPQQQTLYDDFTANRFLWYMASLKGLKKNQAKTKIEELLTLVGLKNDRFKKLGSYSGGMKQRILIAQALLNDPKVLILDEPTAGLDPKERIRIRNFISEIALNKIVLLATHVVSDIEYIAKEVILIKNGELLNKDTPSNILTKMNDKVFEAVIKEDELKDYQNKYRVSNIIGESEGVRVRFVCDEMPKDITNVQSVKPTLEDIYLYLFDDM